VHRVSDVRQIEIYAYAVGLVVSDHISSEVEIAITNLKSIIAKY
jgi:hypothetical protein